jgi:predicted acyl esterase
MFGLDMIQGRVGIPADRLSGFESFEGPDPAEWNAHGYAVAQVDARGIFHSEGDHLLAQPSRTLLVSFRARDNTKR